LAQVSLMANETLALSSPRLAAFMTACLPAGCLLPPTSTARTSSSAVPTSSYQAPCRALPPVLPRHGQPATEPAALALHRLAARLGCAFRHVRRELSGEDGDLIDGLAELLERLGERTRPQPSGSAAHNLQRAPRHVPAVVGLLAAVVGGSSGPCPSAPSAPRPPDELQDLRLQVTALRQSSDLVGEQLFKLKQSFNKQVTMLSELKPVVDMSASLIERAFKVKFVGRPGHWSIDEFFHEARRIREARPHIMQRAPVPGMLTNWPHQGGTRGNVPEIPRWRGSGCPTTVMYSRRVILLRKFGNGTISDSEIDELERIDDRLLELECFDTALVDSE